MTHRFHPSAPLIGSHGPTTLATAGHSMGAAEPPPALPRQRVAVYGICEDGTGRVLLTRAAPWLTIAGQWFLPGGGLDHGESPIAALEREFAEETGLRVKVGELRGILSDVTALPDESSLHTVRVVYAIDTFTGTLRDEAAGSTDAAQWVPLGEAWGMPLVPYVRRALTELR